MFTRSFISLLAFYFFHNYSDSSSDTCKWKNHIDLIPLKGQYCILSVEHKVHDIKYRIFI